MAYKKIQIIGNVGRDDASQFNTNSGYSGIKFSVACERQKRENGKWVDDEPEWYNVTAWKNKLFDSLIRNVKSGQRIFVSGDFATRSYTDQQGRNRTSLDITLDAFEMMGRSNNVQNIEQEVQQPVSAVAAVTDPAPVVANTQPMERGEGIENIVEQARAKNAQRGSSGDLPYAVPVAPGAKPAQPDTAVYTADAADDDDIIEGPW